MSSETLIREVDEELRRDRLRNAWRRLGPWIIAAAVAVVLAVAGWEVWSWWQKNQADKSSDQFFSAIELTNGKDLGAAKTALDGVIAGGWGGYPILAKFREAALFAQQGKTDEAVADYDGLASNLDNVHLRELALVLAANVLIDKGDVAAVQQRVGGLVTPADPLRNAAREAIGLTQYKAGKLDDALATFQAILDDHLASQDEQERVEVYVRQLAAAGAKGPVAPPAAADASAANPSEAAAMASNAVDALASAAGATPSASAPASASAASAAPPSSAAASSAP